LIKKRAKASSEEVTKVEYGKGAPETNAKGHQLFLALLAT